MKSITTLALLAGIAGMCFAAHELTAAQALAPTAAGSFTLPYQTSWGTAVLPAGHYTFTLDRGSLQPTIALWQGTKIIAVVLTQAFGLASSSDGSSMQIVNQRVRSLHLAPVGVTYYFQDHKKRNAVLIGRVGVPGASVIPVSGK